MSPGLWKADDILLCRKKDEEDDLNQKLINNRIEMEEKVENDLNKNNIGNN